MACVAGVVVGAVVVPVEVVGAVAGFSGSGFGQPVSAHTATIDIVMIHRPKRIGHIVAQTFDSIDPIQYDHQSN